MIGKFILVVLVLTFVVLASLTSSPYFNHMIPPDRHFKDNSSKVIGGILQHYLWIKPGETKSTLFVLYTSDIGGNARIIVYRVSEVLKTEKLPVPTGLYITVEPSEIYVRPNESYSFNITVSAAPYVSALDNGLECTFLVRVYLKNEVLDDWLRVVVSPQPIPGVSILHTPKIAHTESVTLTAGETNEIICTLYTEETRPGKVSLTIYRTTDIYKIKKLSMPEGLSVDIEPSQLIVKPHGTYKFKIFIKSESKVPPGRYVFCINMNFENGIRGYSWITVNIL